MGQAKKRGTFDERQQIAYNLIDANVEVRKKELEQLEVFEKRQVEALGGYIQHVFEGIENKNKRDSVANTLTRIDFSHVPFALRDARHGLSIRDLIQVTK